MKFTYALNGRLDMTAWMISAHSVAKADKARGNDMWTPKRGKFSRTAVEIYYYCPPDKQLSMSAGWILWDMLMYGEHGGVAAADKLAIEKRGKDVHDWYYEYTVASFKSDAADWMDKKKGHHPGSAYGVWEVGNPDADPVYDMSEPTTLLAVDLIARAALEGVKRIYWTSCQAFEDKAGKLTPSSQQVYSPAGLPARR
jgi:hypothetical protein